MEPFEATKLTVYTGDSSRYEHKVLYRAIVEVLLEEKDCRCHGRSWYRRLRLAQTYSHRQNRDLSVDLPVMVIAVDRTEKIEAVLPRLETMIDKGLVTTEKSAGGSLSGQQSI